MQRRCAGTSFFTANTLLRYQLNGSFPHFNGNLTPDGLNSGRIDYNSLRVNYKVRMSGLTLMTNYTLSRMPDRDGFIDPVNGVEQLSSILWQR